MKIFNFFNFPNVKYLSDKTNFKKEGGWMIKQNNDINNFELSR